MTMSPLNTLFIWVVLATLGGNVFAQENTPEPEAGPYAWKRTSADHVDELERSGLLQRYTVTRIDEDLYERLFRSKEFDAVEADLRLRFSRIADPWNAREYSLTVNSVGVLRYGYDPDRVLAVAREWTDVSPQSHWAWLVRGAVEKRYGWYWRGNGADDSVSELGWQKFREHIQLARQCLDRSHELQPKDPEPLAHAINVAMAAGSDEDIEKYFRGAVALAPTHVLAHEERLRALYPYWGGTWEQVDEFLAQCTKTAAERDDPLLLTVRYGAYVEMKANRRGFDSKRDDTVLANSILEGFEKSVQRWPDERKVLSDYCRVLYEFGRYEQAHEQFEKLGDVFFLPNNWRNLEQLNYHRAYALYMTARTVNDIDRKMEMLFAAIEIEPIAEILNQIAHEFRVQGDFESAEQYYQQALEVDPEFDNTWYSFTGLYIKMGRREDALRLIEASRQYEINDNMRAEFLKLENQLKSGRGAPQ